jgi:hypothetical protein
VARLLRFLLFYLFDILTIKGEKRVIFIYIVFYSSV